MEVDVFFLLYLGAGMALVFGMGFYYDWRDKHRFEEHRDRVIYHCIKCGRIYTGPHGSEEAGCPDCNFTNGRLSF
jgi:hypothetical protein